MQTISHYSIDAYKQIANSQLAPDDTILSSLSLMPLILQAAVAVQDGATYDIYNAPDTIEKYAKWHYFTGEIEQYVEGTTRVLSLPHFIIATYVFYRNFPCGSSSTAIKATSKKPSTL